MNFIPRAEVDLSWTYPWLAVLGVLAVAALVLLFVLEAKVLANKASARAKKFYEGPLNPITATLVCAAFACVLAVGIAYIPLTENALEAQREGFQSEVESFYGVVLTDDQARSLHYPSKAPSENFVVYGTVEISSLTPEDTILKREVSLVWRGGEFILASSENGETFVPLDPKK